MTALTPQQMRELAEELDQEAQQWDGEGVVGPKFTNGAAALRTAADQLDAVRAWNGCAVSERTHYLSCAPESYDSTAIYGVFDTWPEARDAAMNAEYVSTSAEIQEWVAGELGRTWTRWGNEWRSGYGASEEVRY